MIETSYMTVGIGYIAGIIAFLLVRYVVATVKRHRNDLVDIGKNMKEADLWLTNTGIGTSTTQDLPDEKDLGTSD